MKYTKSFIFIGLCIFIFNFLIRIYFASQIKGVSGGDAYNNLFIARYIAEFQNPFEGARRLPFYPLLLVPTQFINIDPIFYSRAVSAATGALVPVVIFFFSALSGLGVFSSLIVAILSGFSPSVFFISIRPLSNSTFAFLAIFSIYRFYKLDLAKKFKPDVLISLGMGFMSMTRHEGFIISAIIFIFLFIKAYRKKALKDFFLMVIPFIIIVLPFFANNYIKFKNLFYSDYLEYPEGLWMPKNFIEVVRNYEMLLDVFPQIWFSGAKLGWLRNLLSFFSLVGVFVFIRKMKKNALPLLFILFSQIAISFWYQPTIRYWLQIIPFVIFFMVYGLNVIFEKVKLKGMFFLVLLTLSAISAKSLFSYMTGTVRDLNVGTTGEYLLRKALLESNSLPGGKIGLPADYPQAVYFLKKRGDYYTTRPPKKDPLEVQRAWVLNKNLEYIIITSEHDFLDVVYKDEYELIKEYIEGDDWIRLYKVI